MIEELQRECGYDPDEDGTVDELIAYKDALEDAFRRLLDASTPEGACIRFPGEASECFANTLPAFAGYTVEVIPDDEEAEPFTAVLVGSAADEIDDYYAVRVRRFDEATGEGTGEPFAVVARELRVY